MDLIEQALVDLFKGDVFAIGGTVRDRLINSEESSKDLDVVVLNHSFTQIRALLEAAGARVDVVGASFACVKVTLHGATIDLALPRRATGAITNVDIERDFASDISLEEDMRRRDFTVNAISIQLQTEKVFALPGALEDLAGGVIRMTSEEAFRNDPLRMLRAAQFASRLGFAIEAATAEAIRRNAHLLRGVAAERIAEELAKLLVRSRVPSVGIRAIVDLGLMEHVAPELLESVGVVQNRHHAFDVFGHLCAALDAAAAKGGDLVDRLAALLHDVGKPRTVAPRADGQGNTFFGHETIGAAMARSILGRLRFKDVIVDHVSSLIANHMFIACNSDGTPLSDIAVRRLVRRIRPDLVERQFALRQADMAGSGTERGIQRARTTALRERINAMLAATPVLDRGRLAVNGGDLLALAGGTGRGPWVGAILSALLERVIDQPELNERETLLQMASELLAAA